MIFSGFEDDQWTVSLSGPPFHNVALDEVHEMVVSRRLKQMTSRPSCFRTVELAGFIAYMYRVMLKFEYFLCASISMQFTLSYRGLMSCSHYLLTWACLS